MNLETIAGVLEYTPMRPMPKNGNTHSAIATIDIFTIELCARHVSGKEYFLTLTHNGEPMFSRVYSESRDGTTRGDSRVMDMFETYAAKELKNYRAA